MDKVIVFYTEFIFLTLRVFISDFAGIMQICTEKGEKKHEKNNVNFNCTHNALCIHRLYG